MRELSLARRVEDADLDRPDRPDAPRVAGDLQGLDDRRVVELHVADLEAGSVIGGEPGRDGVGLGERPGERLLGEDRHAPVETGKDGIAMRARR